MKLIRKKSQLKPVAWGLRDYHARRNHVLILRETGGLGDILAMRMMFEGFKRVMPDANITWAVPRQYFAAAINHPFVDEVVDCREVNKEDFNIVFNVTFCCGRYEIKIAPVADKNRSDIWADHCGVMLTSHDMHLSVGDDARNEAWQRVASCLSRPDAPVVIFCPVSAQQGKDLNTTQQIGIVQRLWKKGCNVIALHDKKIPELSDAGCPVLTGISIEQWMATIAIADYVVSVDTASFHCAGGLKKPTTGIFTYVDGKVYSRYYEAEIVQKHRDDGDWECGPCYNWSLCTRDCGASPVKPCATLITPDMVMKGVERMFARWPYKTRQHTHLNHEDSGK